MLVTAPKGTKYSHPTSRKVKSIPSKTNSHCTESTLQSKGSDVVSGAAETTQHEIDGKERHASDMDRLQTHATEGLRRGRAGAGLGLSESTRVRPGDPNPALQ